MNFNPTTTAFLMLDCQNDFAAQGGVFYPNVAPVMNAVQTIDNLLIAVNAARNVRIPIVHAPLSFADGYRELNATPYGFLKRITDNRAFLKGNWGTNIVDRLAPAIVDIVIEGKRGFDAFASSDLEFILGGKGIRTLVMGGFLTNLSVESTMRTAFERGYDVVTLTDCTAAMSNDEQLNSVRYSYPMFSHPLTARAFATAVTQL